MTISIIEVTMAGLMVLVSLLYYRTYIGAILWGILFSISLFNFKKTVIPNDQRSKQFAQRSYSKNRIMFRSLCYGCALGFLIVINFSLVMNVKNRFQDVKAKDPVTAICATKDLSAGTVLSGEDFIRKEINQQFAEKNKYVVYDDVYQLLGHRLIFSVKQGQPILLSDVE